MPHKRSISSLKRRIIRGLIFRYAYYDSLKDETVSRLGRSDVLALINCGDGFSISLVPLVEKGEVLVDSRGLGSFQRIRH